MRIGGEHALADAKAGKDGGFKNATFVEAGKRLRELAALEPFQPGYLSTKHAEFGGHVRRRQGGDGPDGAMAARHAGRPNSTSGKGWPRRTSASCRSPSFPAAKARRPIRSAASTAGSSASPPRPRRSTSSSSSARRNMPRTSAEKAAYIPVVKGLGNRIHRSAVQAPGGRSRQDDLPSELLRSGPRPLGRTGD